MNIDIMGSLVKGRQTLAALIVAATLGIFICAGSASAGIEQIQWRLEPNNPFAQYYPNDYQRQYPKLLEFKAQIENPTDLDGKLTVFFDYIDPADPTKPVYTDPVSFEIPHDGTVSITTTETLDFCPPRVSLHFYGEGAPLMEVNGTFYHECQVPEPSTALAAGLGLLTLGVALRRRV